MASNERCHVLRDRALTGRWKRLENFISVANVSQSNKLVIHDTQNRRNLELFRKGEGDGDSSATGDRCEKSGTHSVRKLC